MSKILVIVALFLLLPFFVYYRYFDHNQVYINAGEGYELVTPTPVLSVSEFC